MDIGVNINILVNKKCFSVLIPDGESFFALSVLRCLGQMKNINTYILSNLNWSPVRFSRYSNQYFSYKKAKCDEERLSAIYDIVKRTKVDVVLPVNEHTIRLLSLQKDKFSEITSIVALPKVDVFDIVSDKWLFSKWLKKYQIPHPKTILYQNNAEFNEEVSSIQFPVLIKPTFGYGGKGIKLFDNQTELRSYFKENILSEEFIVQSFINGDDFGCSVLCEEGKILAHTIQKKILCGMNSFTPSEGIEFLFDGNIFKVVEEVIQKLNWSGIGHFDLRFDKDKKQINVIEMNPRYWMSLLGSLQAGINFPYLACLASLKYDFPKLLVRPHSYVQAKHFIKLMTQRFIDRKGMDPYYDISDIGIILKDPLPFIFDKCSIVYRKFRT